jgi:NAD(P)-dependent dehydrogenase (short-subunit alcohol dehydrogenase family)
MKAISEERGIKKEGEGFMSYKYKKLFSLANKVALVVGAAGGLAGETCLALAEFGATIALADIDSKGLIDVKNDLGKKGFKTWSRIVDVSDVTSVEKLIEELREQFGRLDIMINFAGVVLPTPVEKIRMTEFQKIIDINLKGSFILAQQSLFVMLPQRSGKIILVGSVSGYIGRPLSAHYAASKGGVHAMVRTMAVEMAKNNIQINSIAPVFTLTKMSEDVLSDPEMKKSIISTIPMGRLGLPSDLVGAMIFLSSSASDFVTGQTIFVDGGCTIS